MSDRIIVALDCSRDEALALADRLVGRATWLKVGMTLYYAAGPSIVEELRQRGFSVFVDLKLHDIPHQVEGAAASLAALEAGMITLHASGGVPMMRSALRGAVFGALDAGTSAPSVLAVTVLTSMDAETLASTGVNRSPAEQVEHLGLLAREAGVDGVVCSPNEASIMRSVLGPDALVVTPGVRPEWAARGDQSRVATPAEALARGASHLVIGRPITEADDPVAAFDRIVEEIKGASL